MNLNDSKAYSIQKKSAAGWEPVAFAISTAEADRMIAQKMRFESGKFRAIPANGKKVA